MAWQHRSGAASLSMPLAAAAAAWEEQGQQHSCIRLVSLLLQTQLRSSLGGHGADASNTARGG